MGSKDKTIGGSGEYPLSKAPKRKKGKVKTKARTNSQGEERKPEPGRPEASPEYPL